MKRVLLAAALILAGLAAAGAADRATLSVIGFSSEGDSFAFEQFSIGDEARPAFSQISVIDLATGKALPGAPYSATGGTEEDILNAIRDSVWGMAGEVLAEHNMTEPANPLVLTGDGDRTEATRLLFGIPGTGEATTITGQFGLSLSLIDMPTSGKCTPDSGTLQGFALNLNHDGVETPVYADTALPAERACATGYRLYGVFAPHNGGGPERWVAMVSVFTPGFEGHDRRFIAIPLGLHLP